MGFGDGRGGGGGRGGSGGSAWDTTAISIRDQTARGWDSERGMGHEGGCNGVHVIERLSTPQRWRCDVCADRVG